METETLDARGRPRSQFQTVNNKPSLTVQSDVNQAEISAVMKKYVDLGIRDHLTAVDLRFKDVTEFNDYRDVFIHAKEAENEFMTLDPRLRAVFDNDVARWLDAAHDPEKLAMYRKPLEKLGLWEPDSAPPEQPTRDDPTPAPAPVGAE